jgi:2-C-methyl-D-erythritol 4-phosphate cytidylyltransferase
MKKGIYAIIVAAGQGIRMGSSVPKQFMQLHGKPILYYTVDKFVQAQIFDKIILVVGHTKYELVKKMLDSDNSISPENFLLVAGGKKRQNSVFNALRKCEGEAEIVVVHDGVRPFVKVEELRDIVELAKEKKAVTLGLPVKNTIKRARNGVVVETVFRDGLFQILTPQAFWFDILYQAHKKAKEKDFYANDDAELVEALGKDVFVLQGSPENIKITDQFDLKIAEAILNRIRKK